MKKVILIVSNNDIGLYKFRKELIQRLVEEDNKVYVSIPKGEYVSKLEKLGCVFVETPINRRGKNPLTDFKLLIKYYGIIKKVKPNVVLSYTIKPNIYGGIACRLLRVPYIANITGLGSALENNGVLKTLTIALYNISLKRAKCVFFQNKENQNFMVANNIVDNNYRLIPGSGVNIEHYQLIDYPNDNKIHFLFIARIIKEKGIDEYLDAAEYIRTKYPNTVFHILGTCENYYLQRINSMQDKGIILYHGRQDDVRQFHKFSHCTIHPSYYPEGMSNVLLESAACGRPIITTNRSGCREIVDEGQNGFLVNQQDSNELIKAIEKFIKLDLNTKKQMGIWGREKVIKEFDRQIVVQAYIEELNKIQVV